MDNDYYTIKDIIFSLRPYYLDNEKRLQQLKDLCYIVDENVSDFYFYVQKMGKDYCLYCKYLHNIDTLKGLITYLNIKTGTYVYGKNISKLTALDNGICYFDDKYFKIFINAEKMDCFYKMVSEITTSSFVNNINLENYFDGKNPGLYINSNEFIVEFYYFDKYT